MKELDFIFKNLPTTDESNFFIKSFESFLKGNVTKDSLISSYPFLKDTDLDKLKRDFSKIRTELLSRKKVKIYTPITLSRELIIFIHSILTKFSNSIISIETTIDSSIVAGLKFNLDGRVYNLTLDNINQKKMVNK